MAAMPEALDAAEAALRELHVVPMPHPMPMPSPQPRPKRR
jgi:hypothetical protein